MQEELLKIEKQFSLAVVANDAEAVGRFLADDWIMIDPDGGIIDRARFLAVIESSALTHELMESDDIRVRIHGDTAMVTALTTTRGKYSGKREIIPLFGFYVFAERSGARLRGATAITAADVA